MNIPQQYRPVMPYIIVEDPEAFLEFTKKVLNAREQLIIPVEGKRSIMHGEININGGVIMFAGANDNWAAKTAGMFVYVANVDEVYATALENGATSLAKPSHQDYGYSGGFEDPFGNQWWICNAE